MHAFTVATVYGGLKAARNFAVCFGDREKAARYDKAAEEIRAAAEKYLYSERLGRFVRRLVPRNQPAPANSPIGLDEPSLFGAPMTPDSIYEVDEVLDSSLYAIHKFHLFSADDPRVAATMQAVEEKLWVKTKVGGVARYENDYYHRVSNDIAAVPGNPWFICTLWLADYFITRAKTAAELKLALPVFEWTAAHALESGVLAEQVNPYTNEPMSVSPLTWSHATVVSTAVKYLEKLEQLQNCDSCGHPVYRLRNRGTVELADNVSFSRFEATFLGLTDESRVAAAPIGCFMKHDPRSRQNVKVSLAVSTRDCIGCDVCVAHCERGVLRMLDGKAQIDLRHMERCDLDGHCVEVCPTDAVSLTIMPGHNEQPNHPLRPTGTDGPRE